MHYRRCVTCSRWCYCLFRASHIHSTTQAPPSNSSSRAPGACISCDTAQQMPDATISMVHATITFLVYGYMPRGTNTTIIAIVLYQMRSRVYHAPAWGHAAPLRNTLPVVWAYYSSCTDWQCSTVSGVRTMVASGASGSRTSTGWKQRASAASPSMRFRYSWMVEAAMQRREPLARAGLSSALMSGPPAELPPEDIGAPAPQRTSNNTSCACTSYSTVGPRIIAALQ